MDEFQFGARHLIGTMSVQPTISDDRTRGSLFDQRKDKWVALVSQEQSEAQQLSQAQQQVKQAQLQRQAQEQQAAQAVQAAQEAVQAAQLHAQQQDPQRQGTSRQQVSYAYSCGQQLFSCSSIVVERSARNTVISAAMRR